MKKRNIRFVNTILLAATILLSTLIACKKDKTDRFNVIYEVEFEPTWNATTHPGAFPAGAGFAPFIATTYLNSVEVFSEGLPPSEALTEYVLNGSTSIFESEFIFLINTSRALDFVIGDGVSYPATSSVLLGTARGYHFVTLISRITPSPDWFIAAQTSLIDPVDGEWYNRVTIEAIAYDAGLDTATTFLPPYLPLDTASSIELLKNGPLTLSSDTVFNMGRFILTRVK